MERVWGGNGLAENFGKPVPAGKRIGEAWEISDRPEGQSTVASGPLAGRTLRWLMESHQHELLGNAKPVNGRFPLLVKILDSADKLSLQVHPPASLAAQLGGEPKTEMWYITHTLPGADLFVGLRSGLGRTDFEAALAKKQVADCFHRIEVKPGDCMFLPSGRVHALGAGVTMFEVQQNSDTTYRVYDWDRVGLDGKPRELHVEQSLACIDFADHTPDLVKAVETTIAGAVRRELIDNSLFKITVWRSPAGGAIPLHKPGICQIVASVKGTLKIAATPTDAGFELLAGQFAILPAECAGVEISGSAAGEFLVAEPGGAAA